MAFGRSALSPGGNSRQGELLAVLERRLGLTSVGLITLGVAALGWVVGRIIESRGLFLLVYGVVLVVAIAWVLGRRKLAVDAGRSKLPTRVRAGQPVSVELQLTARRRVSTLILEEVLDDQLGPDVRVPVPLLPSGEQVNHTYTFTPKLRGIYDVGPLVAEWNDPFGLTRSRLTLCEKTSLIVHPSIEAVVDRVTSREWEDPPVRPPIFKPWPSGFEFYGLRDYVDGDDPRRIVWRAVAQYDKYLVRESEQGITDRVNIFLDTDREWHSPGIPSETFETAVRAVAALGIKHLKDGFAVSVECNGERLAKNMRGIGRQIPFLDKLAAVDMEKDSLTSALDRLYVDPARNSHNVIVTPYLSPQSASRIRLMRDRGTAVMIVLILWDDTDPSTIHRAGGIGCNVVEINAGQSLARVFDHVVGARR